jgi:hypothetical protein
MGVGIMIIRKQLIWKLLIGIMWISGIVCEAKEEVKEVPPYMRMHSDTPDPMMVWLYNHQNAPQLKAAGYPFDALDQEPIYDHYMKSLALKEEGKAVNFMKVIIPKGTNLIRIAQLIIDINQHPDYKNGNQQNFLKDWIQKHRVIKEDPLVHYYSRQLLNKPELAAAFVLAGNNDLITDIIPFLECADKHIGSPARASANHHFFNSRIGQPSQLVPPLKRICFWPAANAIVSNPTTTIPLLQEILMDSSSSDELRLRAAAFMLELEPSWFNQKLLTNLNELEKESLFTSVSKGFQFRNSLLHVLDRWQNPTERDLRRTYLNFMKLNH